MASAALQRGGAVVTCRATQCVGLSDLMALQLLVLGNHHRMQEDLSMALASQGLLFPVLRVTRSRPITICSVAPIGAGSVMSSNRVTAKFSTIFI